MKIPRVGETWSFRGGRHDTIKRIKSGAFGSWDYINGKLVAKQLKTRCINIQWESGFITINVKSLLRDWKFVPRHKNKDTMTPSTDAKTPHNQP